MKAYILMGAPGSGKSTWVKGREEFAGALSVCSADLYFTNHFGERGVYNFDPSKLGTAHAHSLKIFINTCQFGDCDVVCDNTNTKIDEIAPYIAVAQAYDYEVEVVYFRYSPSEAEKLFERNVHGVPLHAIERMLYQAEHTIENWPQRWPTVKVI